MKKRIPTFLAGMLTMALVCGLSVSALAASGLIQLDVRPINVMVKGKQFKPKDANGEDVLVFTYQGTTYAPLRSLAEAYGLEVGYDAAANMATVNEPSAPPAIPVVINGELAPGSLPEPTSVNKIYTLYVGAKMEYVGASVWEVSTYDRKYDIGEISTYDATYYMASIIFSEFPQHKDKIIDEIRLGNIPCVQYKNSVYIDLRGMNEYFIKNGITLRYYFTGTQNT